MGNILLALLLPAIHAVAKTLYIPATHQHMDQLNLLWKYPWFHHTDDIVIKRLKP